MKALVLLLASLFCFGRNGSNVGGENQITVASRLAFRTIAF